jgi:catecholate siderophore receptor
MNYQRTPLAAAILAAIVSQVSTSQLAFAEPTESETTLTPVKVRDTGIENDYAPALSTVGAKTATPIRDIPQTVNVINRAVLDAQAVTSLKDALRNVPGITISAGEGGTIGDNINLRGFSARTDVYIDGFRDRGQYTRDTFYLDAVEVLKGPSSMLFGRGSTGGVINQASKKPDLNKRGEVSLSLGTDDYYRTTVDINQPIADSAAIRVAAFGQDVQSTRDVVHNKDFGFAPSLKLGIGSPTEITLSGLVQRNNDIPDYGFPLIRSEATINSVAQPAKAPKDRFYGYADDHNDQDVDSFSLVVKHSINKDTTLTNRTQYAQYRIVASPTPLGTQTINRVADTIPTQNTPLDQIWAQRQDKDRTINDSTLSNQTDLAMKLQTGAVRHTLTTGFEFEIDRYAQDSYTWSPANPTVNLGNPVLEDRPGSRYQSQDTNVDADTFGVYINDQIDLSEQWKLVGGLRWDRFRADANQIAYDATGAVATGPTSATNNSPKTYSAGTTNTMVSTRAGVIWQPDDVQSYYVSYGTSFNPSAEGVTLAYNQRDTDPEKNRSYEIGSKLDLLQGDLQLNAAVFQIEKTNARSTVNNVVTLDGDIRVRGFEASALGHVTPEWQVLVSYTRLDGEVVDSEEFTTLKLLGGGDSPHINSKGNTLQNTPKDTATLWTTYTLFGDWEVGGGAMYASKRNVNNFETAEIDGYTRLDATLAYRQPKYDIRLNLQNATDKKYFEAASQGRATPVAGRTTILTTTYRF